MPYKGKPFSEEHKKKLSESQKRRFSISKHPMFGKKLSKERIANSRAFQSKPYSEKYRNSDAFLLRNKKISETRKRLFKEGILKPSHTCYKQGHDVSLELRKKVSLQWKGKKKKPFSSEHKMNLSKAMKNNKIAFGKTWNWSKEAKERAIGKRLSEETKRKIRIARLKQVIPVRDTYPERIIQELLKENGILFQKHKSILGQPDIFIEPNICIFIDGCYWHGCQKCFDRNKTNSIQRKKIMIDLLVTETLLKRGYKVLRIWEHEIYENIDLCKKRITEVIECPICEK